MGAIVAIKLSSDLMAGEPITKVTLYNVKAGEGGADRPCSQFQNVFAQISIFSLQIRKIYLSGFQNIFLKVSKCVCSNCNPSPSLHSKEPSLIYLLVLRFFYLNSSENISKERFNGQIK